MKIEDLVFNDGMGTYKYKEVKNLLPQHNVAHYTVINGRFYEKIIAKL